MEKLQGPDSTKWSWGQMHHVRFRHPLDQMPGAAALTDPAPVSRPGDEYTVNATGYYDSSFDQVSGASYREILDLSDWDHSVAVNVPGQSGQPASPHYSDLIPLWSEGKYFPLAVFAGSGRERSHRQVGVAAVRKLSGRVILSGVSASLREADTESKDPYPRDYGFDYVRILAGAKLLP